MLTVHAFGNFAAAPVCRLRAAAMEKKGRVKKLIIFFALAAKMRPGREVGGLVPGEFNSRNWQPSFRQGFKPGSIAGFFRMPDHVRQDGLVVWRRAL
jgi:hypothetical protein